MKNKILYTTPPFILLITYTLINKKSYLKDFVIVLLLIFVVYEILNFFFKKDRRLPVFILFFQITTFLLLILSYKSVDIKGERWITEGEIYQSIKSGDKFYPIPVKFSIKYFWGKHFFYIYKDGSIWKEELKNRFNMGSISVEIVDKSSYETGDYVIGVQNNISKNRDLHLIPPAGEITIDNNYQLKLLNKTENYDQNYGKAIEINYKKGDQKGEISKYKQWLFKKYPEINNNLSKNDPFTIIYLGEDQKDIFKIKMGYKTPFYLFLKWGAFIFFTIFFMVYRWII